MPNSADVEAIIEACSDQAIARMIGHEGAYTIEDAARYLTGVLLGWQHRTRFVWAVRREGEMIGQVSLDTKGTDNTAIIGYWMAPSGRGNGYLVEAGRTVLAWALDAGGGGLQRVVWHAYVTNAGSIKIAQRLGFKLLGVRAQGELIWNHRGDAYQAELLAGDDHQPQTWQL